MNTSLKENVLFKSALVESTKISKSDIEELRDYRTKQERWRPLGEGAGDPPAAGGPRATVLFRSQRPPRRKWSFSAARTHAAHRRHPGHGDGGRRRRRRPGAGGLGAVPARRRPGEGAAGSASRGRPVRAPKAGPRAASPAAGPVRLLRDWGPPKRFYVFSLLGTSSFPARLGRLDGFEPRPYLHLIGLWLVHPDWGLWVEAGQGEAGGPGRSLLRWSRRRSGC